MKREMRVFSLWIDIRREILGTFFLEFEICLSAGVQKMKKKTCAVCECVCVCVFAWVFCVITTSEWVSESVLARNKSYGPHLMIQLVLRQHCSFFSLPRFSFGDCGESVYD